MAPKLLRNFIFLLLIFLASALMSACGRGGPKPPASGSSPTPANPTLPSIPSLQDTPALPDPSPTPGIDMAAWVNGEGIPLADYEAELQRYLNANASGQGIQEQIEKQVIDAMVDEALLAQAARADGFNLDETALQGRLAALADAAGSEQALQVWMAANSYTNDSFRQAVLQAAAAAWMRDKIAISVPEKAAQVHVQHILVSSLTQANQVLEQIRSGTSFATLALRLDPVNAGDLGWFPRGYLELTALEEAAFSLSAGEVSEIIQTPLGFHILQVIEISADQPLMPDARLVLQKKAINDWLQQQRSRAEIRILLP